MTFDPDAIDAGPDPGAFDPDAIDAGPEPVAFDPDAIDARPDPGAFDPDAFDAGPDPGAFDPDAFDAGPDPGAFDPDAFLQKAEAAPPAPSPTAGDITKHVAGEILRGVAEIPAGTLEFAAIGDAYLDPIMPAVFGGQTGKGPDEMEAGKAAATIRAKAAEILPADPRLAGQFWPSTVPNAIGQMAGFIAPGAAAVRYAGRRVLTRAAKEGMSRELTEAAIKKSAARASAATSGTLGAAVSGAAGYRDAIDNGADPEAAFYSFVLNSVAGTSEAIPIAELFKRLDRGTKGGIRRALYDAGIEAATEAIQEATQTTAGNVIARALYDADRDFWDGVAEGAGAGGVAGALASVLFSAIGGKGPKGARAPKADATAPAQPQEPAEAPPPEPSRPPRWEIPQPFEGPTLTFTPAMPEAERADWARMLAQLPNDKARLRAIAQLGQDPREFGFWSAEEIQAEETARAAGAPPAASPRPEPAPEPPAASPEATQEPAEPAAEPFDPDAFIEAAEGAQTGPATQTFIPGMEPPAPAKQPEIRFEKSDPFPGPHLTFAPQLDQATRDHWSRRLAGLAGDTARRSALRRAGIDPREFGLWTKAEKNAEHYARNQQRLEQEAARAEQWQRDMERQAAEARAQGEIDRAEAEKRRKLEAARRAMEEAQRKAAIQAEEAKRWAAMDEDELRDRAAGADPKARQELIRRHGEDFSPELLRDLAEREERIAAEEAQGAALADEWNQAQEEAEAELAANAYELLEAVRAVGGIPPNDFLSGEMRNLRQSARNAAMLLIRRSQKKSLDIVRADLEQYGFSFETPADLIDALIARVSTGKKTYGTRTAGLQFSRRRRPAAEQTRGLFDEAAPDRSAEPALRTGIAADTITPGAANIEAAKRAIEAGHPIGRDTAAALDKMPEGWRGDGLYWFPPTPQAPPEARGWHRRQPPADSPVAAAILARRARLERSSKKPTDWQSKWLEQYQQWLDATHAPDAIDLDALHRFADGDFDGIRLAAAFTTPELLRAYQQARLAQHLAYYPQFDRRLPQTPAEAALAQRLSTLFYQLHLAIQRKATAAERLAFSRERVAKTPDEQAQDEEWKARLAAFLDNPAADRRQNLQIGPVPPVLRAAGFSAAPLVIAPSTIEKVMGDLHGLPRKVMEDLPAALRDPIMIFDSATRPGAATVLTEIRHEGQSILAAIHLDRPSPNQPANVVASVYGKSSPRAIEGWIKAGLLRYTHRAKTRQWFRSAGITMPKQASTKSNPKLLTDEEIKDRTRQSNLSARLQLPGEDQRAGSGDTLPHKSDPVKPPPEWSRTRAPGRRQPLGQAEREGLQEAAGAWLGRLKRAFPGLAQSLELTFTNAPALVEAGLATPEELTGTEEAAYSHALRTIFLFDHLLDNPQSSDLVGHTIHEAAHAFWHTLPDPLKMELARQWRAERNLQTGPLFDAAGNIREGVAEGIETDVAEWFSERMAMALRHRAERRLTTTDGPLFIQLAEAFLNWVRGMLARLGPLRQADGRPAPPTLADTAAEVLYDWLTGETRSGDPEAFAWAEAHEGGNLTDWIANFWAQYAATDEAFRYPKSDSQDIAEVVAAISDGGQPLITEPFPNTPNSPVVAHRIISRLGRIIVGYRKDGSGAYVGATEANSQGTEDGGGAAMYQAALDWIHNNGQTYHTGELSQINSRRIVSAMLSSSLRHATTVHLLPGDRAHLHLSRWKEGEHAQNTALLALAELANFEAAAAGTPLARLQFDPARGTFIDHDGRTQSFEQIREHVQSAGIHRHGFGASTVARAILTRTALSAYLGALRAGDAGQPDNQRPSAAQRLVTLAESAPRHLLYSRARAPKTRAELEAELTEINDDLTALMRLRAGAMAQREGGDLEATRRLGEIDRSLKRLRARKGDLLADLGDLPPDSPAPTAAEVTSGAAVPGMEAGNVTTPPPAPDPEPEAAVPEAAPQQPPGPPPEPRPILQTPIESKISATVASTFSPPNRISEWLGTIKKIISGFKGPIPELPVTGPDAELGRRLQNGYRRMKSATDQALWHAEHAVAHVLKPLMDLDIPMEHGLTRELAGLQARLAEAQAKKLPPPTWLVKRHDELTRRSRANPYHLFREAVLFRDLWFRGTLDSGRTDDAGRPIPVQLPFGITVEDCRAHLTAIHAAIYESPHRDAIEESLRRHYQLAEDIKTGLLARGYIIPEELTNPFYFPHTILDRYSGKLARVKIDTKEDFRGYLQRLVGSAKAIETDYLMAMYKHAAEVFAHNLRQDIVEQYWKPYDIADDLKARANARARAQGRRARPGEWRALIPDDHVAWQPDDTLPLRPEAIINRAELEKRLGVSLAEGDLKKQLAEMGVTLTAEDLTAALAAGRPEPWVIPAVAARALDAIIERETRESRKFWDPKGHIDTLLNGWLMGYWKRWKLHSPTTFIRYNFNNIVSDLEKIWTVDPKVFTYLPRAAREVKEWFTRGDGSAEIKAAFRYGVLDTVTAGEVGRIAALPQFRAFDTRGRQIREIASKALWFSTDLANVREAAFRYAKFLADLERIRAGARPVYAGAYWRDVEAEPTPHAKAARIARETFVDYANISATGEFLRRNLIPFYSWIEGNWRYHINLFRNFADLRAPIAPRQRVAQAARGAAALPARAALPTSARGFALRLALAIGAATLWNAFVRYRDDIGDDELSDEDRRRFHILLGRRADGTIELIYAPTALSDILRFFGGNDLARLGGDVFAGRRTFQDAATEWARRLPSDLANQVAQGLRPEIKLAAGMLLRRDIFPDVLDPRPIPAYDMRRFILAQITDPVTAALIERSLNRDFYDPNTMGQWLNQMVLQIRRRDPEQWAYYGIRDEAEQWLAAQGRATDPFASDSPEAQLVRNFRTAIFKGDAAAAMRFYGRLKGMGYNQERFDATIRFMDPLSVIRDKGLRNRFVAELPPHKRDMLNRAYAYYTRLRTEQPLKVFPRRKDIEEPATSAHDPAEARAALRAALRRQPAAGKRARARELLQESLTESQRN